VYGVQPPDLRCLLGKSAGVSAGLAAFRLL
jgi:hypothetical protein